MNCFMGTFESFDKNEVEDFFNKIKPNIYQTYTRIDPESLKTVFVLKYA